MCPQQQLVNNRCVSAFQGSFVAFNIFKMNPFNQLIGRDHRIAAFFFQKQAGGLSSGSVSKDSFGLTMAGLKLHDAISQNTTNQLLPKMNRLLQMQVNRPTTQITGPCSVFDALLEAETLNRIHRNTDLETQEECKADIVDKLLQVDQVEKDFGRVHLLIDKLLANATTDSML